MVDVQLSLMNKPLKPNNDHDQTHVIGRTNIKTILIAILAGAFDTSAFKVDWTLSEPHKHPPGMTRFQEELKDIVGTHQQVEETELPNLPYLDMVVKERIRQHPVG